MSYTGNVNNVADREIRVFRGALFCRGVGVICNITVPTYSVKPTGGLRTETLEAALIAERSIKATKKKLDDGRMKFLDVQFEHMFTQLKSQTSDITILGYPEV